MGSPPEPKILREAKILHGSPPKPLLLGSVLTVSKMVRPHEADSRSGAGQFLQQEDERLVRVAVASRRPISQVRLADR